MSPNAQRTACVPYWKRVLFSRILAGKSAAKKVAYLGVVAALCIAANFFEIKFATVQFSFTIFFSVLAGMLIGPLFGFCAVFLGDGIGYLGNSMGYPYYWWVALSCATMALISGFVMNGIEFDFKAGGYVKLAIVCLLTFFVCSVCINSTGMYYLGLPLYLPKNVTAAAEEYFGGSLTFGIYLLIRFFLLGQIYNSIVNYALLFLALPLLKAIKPLRRDLG